jgi:hypothetical protein
MEAEVYSRNFLIPIFIPMLSLFILIRYFLAFQHIIMTRNIGLRDMLIQYSIQLYLRTHIEIKIDFDDIIDECLFLESFHKYSQLFRNIPGVYLP